MEYGGVISQAEAARRFEVRPHTIGDLVDKWRLTPKRMSNGQAKGLAPEDVEIIARALNQEARVGAA